MAFQETFYSRYVIFKLVWTLLNGLTKTVALDIISQNLLVNKHSDKWIALETKRATNFWLKYFHLLATYDFSREAKITLGN